MQRVARQYLNEDQSTVGWFVPTPKTGRRDHEDRSRQGARHSGDGHSSEALDGGIGLLASLGAAAGAGAAMADNAPPLADRRIDLITYRTGVKDVVVILGSLPAGDAMAGTGNIAIPTLTGMMLDRGTKSLDKFAIAEQLDNVGAQISFSVGMQTLEIRANA